MTTSLMSHPCGETCNEEAEFKISLVVASLEMSDKDSDQMFSEVLMVITWDGNVVKLTNSQPGAEQFNEAMELLVHATPAHISEKMKTKPILLDLSRGCTELGTVKLPISDCFADAVLCGDFNSQTVSNEFKFVRDDQENATTSVYFHVQKLLDDGIAGKLYKELKSQMVKHAKKMRKLAGGEEDDDDCSSDENEPCKDFVCPDEQAEHCKRNLGLDQNVYRIINGILINTKDQTGPCGEKCPATAKYIKELRKRPPAPTPLSSRFEFTQNASKCTQLFDSYCDCERQKAACDVMCPECGGRLNHKPPSSCPKIYSPPREPTGKDDWIDRNIREEDLLKKLCEKYNISIDDVRGVEQQVNFSSTKKVKERKKLKCVKKTKKIASQSTKSSGCIEKIPDRETFNKKSKRKACGVYSYEFGNDYPLRRSYSSIEEGAGDCPNVPKYMGWRWDEPFPGIGDKKWYPGQINTIVRCLMKHHLNPYPYDTIPLTRRDKNGRIIKTCTDYSNHLKFNPALIQKPTLIVQRRDGEYYITMNPLKDKKKLDTDCNPYLNCMPLKFQIKMDPEEIKKHRAKKLLRARGFNRKCSCLDLKCCRCMSENAKKILAYEMKTISEKMQLQQPLQFTELNDSSDSELEMEFVTPSAKIGSWKCKPDVVHCGTQYGLKDFLPPPKTKKVEEKSPKKPRALKAPAKTAKKPKRVIESIFMDPPCQSAVATCQPKCVTIRDPRCC